MRFSLKPVFFGSSSLFFKQDPGEERRRDQREPEQRSDAELRAGHGITC
jgi:hypothetical protein